MDCLREPAAASHAAPHILSVAYSEYGECPLKPRVTPNPRRAEYLWPALPNSKERQVGSSRILGAQLMTHEDLKDRLKQHGITVLSDDGRWTTGKMVVTGGFVEFSAIICDDPDPESSMVINGGRILKLFWDWTSCSLSRVLPNFDREWDIAGSHFIPLHSYGEALDCLNRLLVAVGDEPYKERYIDINAVK